MSATPHLSQAERQAMQSLTSIAAKGLRCAGLDDLRRYTGLGHRIFARALNDIEHKGLIRRIDRGPKIEIVFGGHRLVLDRPAHGGRP